MIMPFFTVDDLIAMRDKSVNTAFMDFNNAVTHHPDALFVFYEGQDNDYYYPRIQQYSSIEVEPINCRGKDKVISVYKILVTKSEYDKYRKGFFIDKDFDLNSDSILSNFYITSGYSAENYYLSDNCMEQFLKQKHNFHAGDPLLDKIMAGYCKTRQSYFDAILLYNTWYCAIRHKYGNDVRDISLGSKMPTGFITCDFVKSSVTQKYTLATIESIFPTHSSYPVTPSELKDAENYIKQDMLKNMRGKFGMRFMLNYISYLQDMFRTDPVYANYKRNLHFSYDNILSILSPFADTEQSLIDYIQKIAA